MQIFGDSQTRRTTRMLETAIAKAVTGEYVQVVGATHTGLSQLASRAEKIATAHGLQVKRGTDTKVYVADSHNQGEISFITADEGLDWATMRIRGLHAPLFLDHYALEIEIAMRYAAAIQHVKMWEHPEQPACGCDACKTQGVNP